MDPRAAIPNVPLHLTALAILSPSNSPLYVHSFTGKQDELRHYHLAHAAVDVIEERIVMTSTPSKPADAYLGLLFCMEDMAFYGFQTNTKLRMVISVALVDAMIKDADIVAIFRAVHHLLLLASHNPFASLPKSFHARPDPAVLPAATNGDEAVREEKLSNPPIKESSMFASGPEDLRMELLTSSRKFQQGIERLGEVLNGGRA